MRVSVALRMSPRNRIGVAGNGRCLRVMTAATLIVLMIAGGVSPADEATHRFMLRAVLARYRPSTNDAPPAANSVAAIKACDVDSALDSSLLPLTRPKEDKPSACVVLADPHGSDRLLLGTTSVTGRAVKRAEARFQEGNGWVVDLQLSRKGSKAFDRLAKRQMHEEIAIVLDSHVLAVPLVQPNNNSFESFHGGIEISADFSQAEARNIASAIKSAGRGAA